MLSGRSTTPRANLALFTFGAAALLAGCEREPADGAAAAVETRATPAGSVARAPDAPAAAPGQ
ncbi:hypothetical protein KZ813_10525 [Sphingomonas sp. RHCKR7]|uniref:hypothetical protein n=1 Tax=Sphingomonas folli TaxID=2862497 RepID=UPI001CA5EFFB|nr:hypothetical protein [Sphingomonas folli]MBW6527274.1 hypothetical protein [Sphingomonas folli]